MLCSPHHPQTNGKLERFHQTLKARVNLLVYTSPEQLRAAMAEFIELYLYRRRRCQETPVVVRAAKSSTDFPGSFRVPDQDSLLRSCGGLGFH
ncbi:MAG: transposase [Acidobacteria bacterium]|nr:transposase [Acidobacteriota bacterium]